VQVPSRETSGPGRIVRPACGSGELRFRGAGLAGCDGCGCDLDRVVLRSTDQIVALPNAIGDHACECGHPEMRRLPEGVFHCPECGSEVLSLEASREQTPEDRRGQAYWCGWIHGRFGRCRMPHRKPDEIFGTVRQARLLPGPPRWQRSVSGTGETE